MTDRLAFTPAGTLDEIVASGGTHLENLGGDRWFLECKNADGSSVAIWFTSKDLRKPTMERRTPETAARRAEALAELAALDNDLL